MTDYQATCTTGTAPVWRFYYWQSLTPTGTSIVFTAQTSSNGSSWGTAVPIGTSAPPPTATSTWTSGPLTVDQALRAANQVSLTYLQVIASLKPNSTDSATPTLTNWQLTYDCVASE